VAEVGKTGARDETHIARPDHDNSHSYSLLPDHDRERPAYRWRWPPLPAPAIGRNALFGQPQSLGRRPALPEHVDRNAPARIPVPTDAQPARTHLVDEALADADGHVLVETAVIAERGEEQLETL